MADLSEKTREPDPAVGARPVSSITARRSAARLSAAQALYQLSLNASTAERVIQEFRAHRLGQTVDGDRYVEAEPELFAAIVRGVTARKPDIERILATVRDGERPIERMEPLLRVLMEAGIWELAANGAVPARVVIGDYVELAHAFFAGPEPGMVNAVLDRVGRRLRPAEMSGADLPPLAG